MTFLAPLLTSAALAGPTEWFYSGTDDTPTVIQVVERSAPTNGQFRIGSGHHVRLTQFVLAGMDSDDTGALLASMPLRSATRLKGTTPVWRLELSEATDPLAFSRWLHEQAGVAWSHPDFELNIVPTSLNDTYWETLWHLENTAIYDNQVEGADVNATGAWEVTRGDGAIIAILDTGVDVEHEDLNVLPGIDYVDGDDDASPVVGSTSYAHGTGMAGIAAAVGDNKQGVAGVAPAAQILPIRLIGDTTTISDVYDAFVWATDAGADVLSNSWSMSAASCEKVPLYAALQAGIDYAVTEGRNGLGAAVVFGSGNASCDISEDGLIGYEPVVGVGASSDRDEVFSYSNYGDHIDVVAPSGPASGGEEQYIRSTDLTGPDGYPSMGTDEYTDTLWGTSASTPMVAASLALILHANPSLTEAEARILLCDTADAIDADNNPYDANGWNATSGCGRVNVGAAVAAAVEAIVFDTGTGTDTATESPADSGTPTDANDDDTATNETSNKTAGCACAHSKDSIHGIALMFGWLGCLWAVRRNTALPT